MPMAAKVILQEGVDRRRAVPIRQRHAEQSGRLVDDDQQVVFEEDLKLAELEGTGASPGTSGSVHPDAHDIASP
jgi:hypothetical protein